MWILALLLSGIFTINSVYAEEGYCGDRGNVGLSITKSWVVPDEWPVDEVLTSRVFSKLGADNQLCRGLGTANFSPSCYEHDYCYGYNLKSQRQCDLDLFNGWLSACLEAYEFQSYNLIASGGGQMVGGSVDLIMDAGGCIVEVGDLAADGVTYLYAKAENGTVYFVKTTAAGANKIKNLVSDLSGDWIESAEDVASGIIDVSRGVFDLAGSTIYGGYKFIKRAGCGFGLLCKTSATTGNSCIDIVGDIANVGEGAIKIGYGIESIPVDAMRGVCALQCGYAAAIMASVVHLSAGGMYDAGSSRSHETLISAAIKNEENTRNVFLNGGASEFVSQQMIDIEKDFRGIRAAQTIPIIGLILN